LTISLKTNAGSLKENLNSFFPWLAVLVFIFLTFSFLDRSLWFDEAVTFYYSRLGPAHTLQNFPSANDHPLNTFLLSFLGTDVSEFWIRFPAFLASFFSLIFFILLGKHLKFTWLAWAIVLPLFAANPFFLVYSVTARGYSMQVLGILMMLYGFLNENGIHWLRSGSLFALGLIICAYALPTGILLLPFSLFLYILKLYKKRKGLPGLQWPRDFNKSLLPVGLGVFLLICLYSGLVEEVLKAKNSYERNTGADQSLWENLYPLLGQGFYAAFLFILLLMAGLFSFQKKLSSAFVFCSGNTVIFILAFLGMGKVPFTRNFLPLLPLIIVLAGLGLSEAFERLKTFKYKFLLEFGILIIFSGIIFQAYEPLFTKYIKAPNALGADLKIGEDWQKAFLALGEKKTENLLVIDRVLGAGSHLYGVPLYLRRYPIYSPQADLAEIINQKIIQGGTFKVSCLQPLNEWIKPPVRFSDNWSRQLSEHFVNVEGRKSIKTAAFFKLTEYTLSNKGNWENLDLNKFNFLSPLTPKKFEGQLAVNQKDKKINIGGKDVSEFLLLPEKGWYEFKETKGRALFCLDITLEANKDICLGLPWGTFHRSEKGVFVKRSVEGRKSSFPNLLLGIIHRKRNNEEIISLPLFICSLTENSWRVWTFCSLKKGDKFRPGFRFSIGNVALNYQIKILHWKQEMLKP